MSTVTRGPATSGLVSTRAVVVVAAALVALTLQVSVLPFVAWHGIVPNLVLLVVVAAALSCGSELAMTVGFGVGLLLDLAPPADHVAGRWALALVAVGLVAGQVRGAARQGPLAVAAIVLASSFVGTSLFALSGVLLRDPVIGVEELLGALGLAMVGDLLLAPFVLVPTLRVLRHLRGPRTEPSPALR